MSFHRICAVGVVTVVVFSVSRAKGEWICWSADKNQQIQCAQPDGSQQTDLLTAAGKPLGLAVDRVNNRLYWAEHDTERIMSVGLSGTVQTSAVVQLPLTAGVRGMGVALSIGKLYWVAEDHVKIQRANLDGTQVEDLAIAAGSFFDVEVDDINGQLYWVAGSQIWLGNLDGSSAVSIVGDADQPYYIALDVAAGKIYWTDFSANEIGRANLDGTNRENPGPINGLLERPIGIAVDPEANKVYWTLESGAVQRANLDGTNVETVLEGLESTWDITIVSSIPSKVVVPTISAWGSVIVALTLLAVGTALTGRRRLSSNGEREKGFSHQRV